MRALSFVLFAASGLLVAGQQESGTLKGADLDLLNGVRRVARNVEQVRGEEFTRSPIAVRVADTMREVAAEIRATNVLPLAQLEARGRAWNDLGLGPVASPRALLLTLASDLGGIGFDPASNRLLVASDRLTAADFFAEDDDDGSMTLLLMTGVRRDEPLVAHLLMHVRQRERAGRDVLAQTTDHLLAASAWAEGEANLTAMLYLFRGMEMSDVVLDHQLDPGGVLDGSLLPARMATATGVESRMLNFVYLEGFWQAVEAYRVGGWNGLRKAMATRTTTRALLHPKNASDGEPEFEEPAPPLDGLTLVDRDVLGEQGIVILVSFLTGKDNLGMIAGEGLRGDRVYRWEAPGAADEGITEWVTRWADPAAAADFDYSFRRCLSARYPGKPMIDSDETHGFLATGHTVFRLSREGSEVRVRVAPTLLDERLTPPP